MCIRTYLPNGHAHNYACTTARPPPIAVFIELGAAQQLMEWITSVVARDVQASPPPTQPAQGIRMSSSTAAPAGHQSNAPLKELCTEKQDPWQIRTGEREVMSTIAMQNTWLPDTTWTPNWTGLLCTKIYDWVRKSNSILSRYNISCFFMRARKVQSRI